MSNSGLVSIFKTLDSIKSAIELGSSTDLAADVAKLVAQVAATTAVSTAVFTYGALQGFGRSLALWRLGRTVSGNEKDIAQSAALAGFVAAELVGHGIDVARDWELGAKLYDWTNPDPLTNNAFNSARAVVLQRDPLVLDLDGDGLELSAASGNTLFDHNADGIKTGTGWARPDDGFLVRDLNGNGSIDSGRELFGVDTERSNGQLATQGFDALADLDSNGDGQITSADAAWGSCRSGAMRTRTASARPVSSARSMRWASRASGSTAPAPARRPGRPSTTTAWR
jgi:hypothetical protein